MTTDRTRPKSIDEYISTLPPGAQRIMEEIRHTIKRAAPQAQEVISYQMPAFKLNGIPVYFAAWKRHIGLYPPVSGDAELEKANAPYAGERGDLIERMVRLRLKQDIAKTAARRKKRV